jgi:hypothetical protein
MINGHSYDKVVKRLFDAIIGYSLKVGEFEPEPKFLNLYRKLLAHGYGELISDYHKIS